jgi:saposin
VNSLECTLCEFVVNYIEKAIGSNRSAAAIEAALEKVCNVLPSSVRPNCTSFVNKYGPIIAILLAKNESAEQVCDFIKVCHNGTQEIAPGKYTLITAFNLIIFYFFTLARPVPAIESKSSSVNSLECTLCEFVINYIEKAIGSNRSAAAIEAALEKVCNVLPSSLRPNCTSFVNKYGLIIAILLAKNESAEQVCDFIKVCHNGTQEIAPGKYTLITAFSLIIFRFFTLARPVPAIESKKSSVNSLECTLCEFVVNYIEKAIGSNRSAAAIEAALEKVCNVLPSSVRPNCTSFVNKYGPIIAILLAKNESAEQVCDFIKVCHNGTQQVAPSNY